MFTKTEKGYLILTLGFLAAGTGIKAYRHASIRLGPFQESTEAVVGMGVGMDSAVSDSGISVSAGELDSLGRPDPWRGQALHGAIPGGGDPVSDSSSVDPVAESQGSASAKASEPIKTARSGSNKSAFTGKIDLNKADASELTRLSGVGAKTAQAIVDYRRAHGPYRDFRDLLRIKGIGEKKLEKLLPNLIL